MAKQVKIKDIAKMANVSAGTVDRILHNRGNVSEASRKAVEQALEITGYKYNIHTSAVSVTKTFKLAIAVPTAVSGEYWGSIIEGINHALEEYSDIKIDCDFAYYNQFDIYSCRTSFDSVVESKPDAVIIGGTFISETVKLCRSLDRLCIPYISVDALIDDTHPVASFSTDQNACGRLLARLLTNMTPANSEYAVFGLERIGNEKSFNSILRKQGLMDYFAEMGLEDKVKEHSLSILNPEECEAQVIDFIKKNRKVKGIAIMNSRGYIIADILEKYRIKGISLLSFDLTTNNSRCLEKGTIAAVICQRPELQGFQAVKTILSHLLYNNCRKGLRQQMPIDIVMKENLPYYKAFFSM